jgi:oligosaccharide repeat unit polymerase
MPWAWTLLAVCALITGSITAWGLATRRFLEPLPVIAVVGLFIFVARPFQLFVDWRDLYSHFYPARGANGLVLLENQEIALYVTDRLREPLEPAFTRAIGACAVFLFAVSVGYVLPVARRLRSAVAHLGARRQDLNLPIAVSLSLAVGFAAQATIIARAGGPAASLESANAQSALSESFVLFLLAGFGFAGMVVWAAWRRPQTRLEWAGFVACVTLNCGFALVSGSRARVFLALVMLAVVKHYLWRPWRLVHVLAGFLALVAFASGYIAFRQNASTTSLSHAFSVAPDYALRPSVVLNDTTAFDDVFYVTSIYGRSRHHRHGNFLLNGVRSYVPRAIDPSKPDGGDIVLRRAVFGNQYGAGRPPTAIGDLYIDFGFPGVVIGALLIGVGARLMLELVASGAAGRQYRVALYAVVLVVLYELVVDSSSIALGYALTFGIPLLVTVHILGRTRWPGLRRRAVTR